MKNIANQTHLSKKNRLHPYYLVYISDEGETVYSIADTKALLEHLRMITKGKNQPEKDLVATYNLATDDGAKMEHYSDLLQRSLENLVESDEETFNESLFTSDTIDFMDSGVDGSDDFELMAFFAVLKGED
ncbi:hypothetical protein [Streptococcus suis]|uniref:hypothetical protein n=1 Tax=Streptococcus suis TaxID=1307 RepID=UPI000768A81B|nr:hypothetical protein [Streptococcus suis]CYV19011.1 helicase [Streptococcus suis]